MYFDFNGASADDGKVVAKVYGSLSDAAEAVADAEDAVANAQAAYDAASTGNDSTAKTNAEAALNAAKENLAAAQLTYENLLRGDDAVYARLKNEACLAVLTDVTYADAGTLAGAVYAYSTGMETEATTAYIGDGKADTLVGTITSFATAANGEDLAYKYFWLLLTDDRGYKESNLDYAEGKLIGVEEEEILGRYAELELADVDVMAGDHIQLAVVAVDADDTMHALAVSQVVAVVEDTEDALQDPLELVSPKDDQTGLSASKPINVKVRNTNDEDGKVHIGWYRPPSRRPSRLTIPARTTTWTTGCSS